MSLDDSLTNLDWLQHLVTFEVTDHKSRNSNVRTESHNQVTDHSTAHVIQNYKSRNSNVRTESHNQVTDHSTAHVIQNDMDYRTNHKIKPPFSYSKLIYMALREGGDDKLTLSAIYSWIFNNFPYYRQTNSNWQVRYWLQI